MHEKLRDAMEENGIYIYGDQDQYSDLGLDSISFISIMVSLEERGIIIPVDLWGEAPKTYSDFYNLIIQSNNEEG